MSINTHTHTHTYIHTYTHTHTHTYAIKYEHNKQKYIRVQCLINIRTAKAFCTTSSEALCILTGINPIMIKTEEAVKQYNVRKVIGSQTQELDTVVDLKDWPQPADCVIITEAKD
jgi:hypothetical protein